MLVKDKISAAIQSALQPEHLEVVDESEMHRGHAGYRDGGQSHFRVTIRCAALDDLSRIARHRAIHNAIGAEMLGDIHALAIDIQKG